MVRMLDFKSKGIGAILGGVMVFCSWSQPSDSLHPAVLIGAKELSRESDRILEMSSSQMDHLPQLLT